MTFFSAIDSTCTCLAFPGVGGMTTFLVDGVLDSSVFSVRLSLSRERVRMFEGLVGGLILVLAPLGRPRYRLSNV